MEAQRMNHYDALDGEIQAKKGNISDVQNFTTAHAAHRLGQYRAKDSAAVASSKLEGYRAATDAMMSHNRRTERILSPSGGQQRPSKLQRPQVYRAGMSATAEPGNGSHGYPVATGGATAGNGAGDVLRDDGSDEGDDSMDAVIQRLTKTIRTRNATVKNQAEEIARYKALLDEVGATATEVDYDTIKGNQRVTNLADDLAMERNLHQKAIESLEQKTREVEQQAEMLQQMEEASAAAHQANLELSRRMEEMNRLAEEEKLRRAQEVDVPAPPEPLAVPPPAVVPGVGDTEELKKELEKLTKMNDMKAKQLEAVQERASKTSTELQYYKGQARSGWFKSFLLKLWWLLRSVGYVGFLLFAYVAVSEDALRSRGVDVYRLAH